MSTHNIGFYEEMAKIMFQLSSNMHFICSDLSLQCLHSPIWQKLWNLIYLVSFARLKIQIVVGFSQCSRSLSL